MRWHGHVERKDAAEPVRSIMEIKGNRGRGRPKMRWMDCIKEDLTVQKLNTDMARDRKMFAKRLGMP